MATATPSAADVAILRQLAERKLAIADDPLNQERRHAWYALDTGVDNREMVLAEHGGVRDQRPPFGDDRLQCVNDWARRVEHGLRTEIFMFEELQDDHVVEPVINVRWHVTATNYGVEPVMHYGGDDGHMGANNWDPPIRDLDADWHLLRPRTFTVDRAATLAEQERLATLFAGLLPVRLRGGHYWTMGLTQVAIKLIGLEPLMLAMYDNPAGLHRLMAFLRDDHLAFSQWLEDEGLYTLNNENDYIGSGSMGYTHDLPATPSAPRVPIRPRDLWVLSESQETVGVGPEQFAEFIFPYQRSIAEKFGKSYYGCCEPVDRRWHVLRQLPNLARVSVSPWADQEFMSRELGRQRVFSRKPNPAMISTGRWDEAAIRADLRHTLTVARDCRLEIIMKDVHTLNNEPERLARWVRIAREEIAHLRP